MDVVSLIMSDHRALERVFDKLEKDEGEQREQLLEQCAALLIPHSKAEEDAVYPQIRQISEELAETVEEGESEHQHAEDLFNQVRANPDDPGVDAMIAGFIAEIKHHIEEEEEEMLPQFRRLCDAETLDRLGRAFVDRKKQELVSMGIDHEAVLRACLEDLTKEQLTERAKAMDLDTPSSMTKGELVEELSHSA